MQTPKELQHYFFLPLLLLLLLLLLRGCCTLSNLPLYVTGGLMGWQVGCRAV
jgi:hypothetical protein